RLISRERSRDRSLLLRIIIIFFYIYIYNQIRRAGRSAISSPRAALLKSAPPACEAQSRPAIFPAASRLNFRPNLAANNWREAQIAGSLGQCLSSRPSSTFKPIIGFRSPFIDSRWDAGLRADIPEFHGSVEPGDFIDWWATVESILAFKAVLEDKRVAFVATRFRGRAATWWMHIMSMRHRQGKSPIISWMKFCKYVEDEFLPFNYDSVVYQQLHNLRQGTRSVDDYTNEFYQLLNRVEVRETKSQLISRY
ncbi:F-box associated ubiquitination effector family protein, partial [Striga hermonthica]